MSSKVTRSADGHSGATCHWALGEVFDERITEKPSSNGMVGQSVEVVNNRLGKGKRASFTFFYEINNQKREIVATGYTRHVCLDPVTAKMIAIPDWLKDRMPDEDLDPTDRFTRKG